VGRSLALIGIGAVLLFFGVLVLGQVIVVSPPPWLSYVTTTVLQFAVTSQGVPVEGAEVHVQGNSGLDVKLYTSSVGYAETVVPASGDYQFTVTKPGFSPYTKSFCSSVGTVSMRFDVDLEKGSGQQTSSFDQTVLGAALSVAGCVLVFLGFSKEHFSNRGMRKKI